MAIKMYSGGSIVGKVSTIGIESKDLAYRSPNFHTGSKGTKYGVVFNVTQL